MAASGFSISRVLGAVRWAWMPLGLCALAAVGVHAAADAVDDRILVLVERLDAFFDTIFADTQTFSQWVDAVGSLERTRIARGIALLWELGVDLAIAVPALGWKERDAHSRRPALREVLTRLNRAPTPTRLFRPLAAVAFALAGAWAVSRMLETALFGTLGNGLLPDAAVEPVARACAGAALVVIAVALGARLGLRTLEYSDALCERKSKAGRPLKLAGLLGTALAVPLALAALVDAIPLLALFR